MNISSFFLKSNSKKLLNKRYYFIFKFYFMFTIFRAKDFYSKTNIPEKIKELVSSGKLIVHQEVNVSSNIGKYYF